MPGSEKAAKRINARIKILERKIKRLDVELKKLHALAKKYKKEDPELKIDTKALKGMSHNMQCGIIKINSLCDMLPGIFRGI